MTKQLNTNNSHSKNDVEVFSGKHLKKNNNKTYKIQAENVYNHIVSEYEQ